MKHAVPVAVPPPIETELDPSVLVQRPDGWYWLADDGRQEVGPFAAAADAQADMRSAQEGAEPGAALREVEDEIGMSDWIDPDTQAPAEQGVPHIEEH